MAEMLKEKLQLIPIENVEGEKPTHDLDEIETALSGWIRVERHQEMVVRVAQGVKDGQYDHLKEEFDPFRGDVVGAEIYITRREEQGLTYYVLGAAGQTEIENEAISRTSHVMYANLGTDLENWANLNQKDRQEKFRTEILPNVRRVIVKFHGWGGRLVVFEGGNVTVLNETPPPVKDYDPTIMNKDEIPNIDKGTLIISLDVMGSGGSLIPDKKELFGVEDIPEQVWEAVDRIGFQVTNIKLRHIASPGRRNAKETLLTQIQGAVAGENFRDNPSQHELIQRLLWMEREEAEIAAGTWWQWQQAEWEGHSMGGTSNLDSAFANWLVERPYISEYQKRINLRAVIMKKYWKEIIKTIRRQETEHYDPEIAEVDRELYQPFSDRVKLPEKGTKGHYPLLNHKILVPVLSGDKADPETLKEQYGWIFTDPTSVDQVREAVNQVSLHKERSSILIHLVNGLIRKGKRKEAEAVLTAGSVIPVIGWKLDHHIGRNAKDFETVKAAHFWSSTREPDFIALCSENLKDISPPATSQTMASLDSESLIEFVKHIIIFANMNDKTVKPNVTRRAGVQLETMFAKIGSEFEEAFRIQYGSNHYSNEDDFSEEQKVTYENLRKFMEARMQGIRDVFGEFYTRHFGRNFYAHQILIAPYKGKAE